MLLGVTAVLSFLLIAIQLYNRMLVHWADDFEVFWLAARMPLETIYIPGPVRPFAYPPSAIPLIKALGLLPQHLSFLVFIGLSAAAFYWAGRRLYSRTAVLMALACPSTVWAFAGASLAA